MASHWDRLWSSPHMIAIWLNPLFSRLKLREFTTLYVHRPHRLFNLMGIKCISLTCYSTSSSIPQTTSTWCLCCNYQLQLSDVNWWRNEYLDFPLLDRLCLCDSWYALIPYPNAVPLQWRAIVGQGFFLLNTVFHTFRGKTAESYVIYLESVIFNT